MKTIGIDISRAFTDKPTGVEVYSTEILLALRSSPMSQNYNFILYHRDKISSKIKSRFPLNFKFKKIGKRRFWTSFWLAKEMKLKSPDLLFVPSHTFPPLLPKKRITTIHDIGWKYFPESYTRKQRILLDKSTKFSVNKADVIFADSIFTKNDLIKFYNAKPDQVKVVYLGFQTNLNPSQINSIVEKEVLKKFTLKSKKYILVLGRIENKKNFKYALKVFGRISESNPKLQFVFAGKMGLGSEKFWEVAKKEGVAKKITTTGYIDPIDLTTLLKNSSVLFHPSLFEGFGLPILEAFNSEIPVVCSSSSSLPEVAGIAALYINPRDINDGVEKLQLVLDNKKIQKNLIRKGKKQLKIFSWERAINEIMSEIEKTLKIN